MKLVKSQSLYNFSKIHVFASIVHASLSLEVKYACSSNSIALEVHPATINQLFATFTGKWISWTENQGRSIF